MGSHIPTPQISHLAPEDYDHIYEPAEDSFILLDALEQDAQLIRQLQPAICVEVGSGSGIVSTFLASLLDSIPTVSIATDINTRACSATLRTAKANKITMDAVYCDLLNPLMRRLTGRVDILLFNPPYVPTTQQEMNATQSERSIGGSWAGGGDGMQVTELLLAQVSKLLSRTGRFYLVAIEQNKPLGIVRRLEAAGLNAKIVLRRRAGGELLSVLCITQRSI